MDWLGSTKTTMQTNLLKHLKDYSRDIALFWEMEYGER